MVEDVRVGPNGVEMRTAVFSDAIIVPALVELARAVRDHQVITGGQADTWIAEQKRRAQDGRLFFVMPLVVAVARR